MIIQLSALDRWENDAVVTPSLSEVIAAESPRIMALSGVEAVAEGVEEGQPCVVVYVSEPPYGLPSQLGGYPVVVRGSPEIQAQPGRP